MTLCTPNVPDWFESIVLFWAEWDILGQRGKVHVRITLKYCTQLRVVLFSS